MTTWFQITSYFTFLLLLYVVPGREINDLLRGKVACVTGASRGIGKGIALGLAEAGATVYITGRSSGDYVTEGKLGGNLQQVVYEIEMLGSKGIAIPTDHRNDVEVKQIFKQIEEESGRLDILVNNAFQIPVDPSGDDDPNLLFKDFWEQPGWFYDSLMDVGLRSHYIASCYAFPLLQKTKMLISSDLSDISSIPAIYHISSFGGVSYSFNVAYGVAKAAVDRMARDMSIELLPHGIACLSLYPGVVRTERMDGILSSGIWRNKTGLAVPDAFIESPRLTGRVIAALHSNIRNKNPEDPKLSHVMTRNGKYQVVAEIAKELNIFDINGSIPPSLRSLKFLLPSLILNNFKVPPKNLEELLIKICPDVLLPMSFMSGGPPTK